jgi:hypothetical protein
METITEINVDSRSVPGLMDLIREATTEEEVNKLVANGKANYLNASPKTVRKWEKVAKQRIVELNTSYVSPKEVKEVSEVKKTEKRKSVKK